MLGLAGTAQDWQCTLVEDFGVRLEGRLEVHLAVRVRMQQGWPAEIAEWHTLGLAGTVQGWQCTVVANLVGHLGGHLAGDLVGLLEGQRH